MKDNQKVNWRKRFFNWHLWSGLAFTIPIVLVAITAILIAHEKGLGTKKIAVNAGWLPGYGSKKNTEHFLNDVKDVIIKNDSSFYASKLGLIILVHKNITIVKGTEGSEVRDLEIIDNRIWLASKEGIFILEKNNTSKLILKGDFHGINKSANTIIASEGKHGFHTSTDNGISWKNSSISKIIGEEKTKEFSESISNTKYMEKLTLEKLALDIHTGKAFFGDGAMWIWIDLIAISLLFMTFTGIWMWYKRTYGKKKNPKKG